MRAGQGARVQVLGLCRFSVPGLGAFQSAPASLADRRAFLYAPSRLGQRFVWFEHVLLPSIRHQTDPDFTLVVLMGEDFPEPWRSRMTALVAGLPQIVLDFAPPADHRQMCHAAIARRIDPAAAAVMQFRLDDDDAVAIDFVERLRAELPVVWPLFARAGFVGLDFCKGVVLSDDGAAPVVTLRRALYWTPALAVLTKPDSPKHILDFPHHIVWRHMPTVTFPDEVMFLRGAHGGNDCAIEPDRRSGSLPEDRWETLLFRRFRISLAGFATALKSSRKT